MIVDGKGEKTMNLIVPGLILFAYACIIVYSFSRKKKNEDKQEETHPCEYCLRWSECNGVDVEFCPLCKK